eukprot:CAMPEP_0184321492 /NCGR_PEP_ID=MMETSP1049-20130417/119327_1 /TAXON_ID=77928 /ORGANISM="Proteomonas sulcata, Strain CCMP704" /LENGTH=218 /DNA_ID=CAMNT_0026642319 /DNA_START=51 /DNA_END=704 /DNA_ORIENTATION=+
MSDLLDEWDFSRGKPGAEQAAQAQGTSLSEIQIQGLNDLPSVNAKPLEIVSDRARPLDPPANGRRTGRQLWAVARAAMADGRIHEAARKARIQTKPKKVELDADGNIKSKQEGTQTSDSTEISNLSPVTCLLHDVCSTTNFAYAEIWFRPPLMQEAEGTDAHGSSDSNNAKAPPMLSQGSQGSLINLHGDNTMGKKGGVSRRISQALHGRNHSNNSLP